MSDELCGAWMPMAKTWCASKKGHKSNCRSASAVAAHYEASRKYDKANREARREVRREINRKYDKANREARREKNRKYRKANRAIENARVCKYNREYNGCVPRGELRDPDFPVWVYALCDDRDRVLYIGQASNTNRRLKYHRAEPHPWRAEIAYIEPLFLTDWSEVDEEERQLINRGGRRLKNEIHWSDTDPEYTTLEELKQLI